MISKKILFRVLAIFTMAVFFLPIFRFNVPSAFVLLVNYNLLTAIWIIAILLLSPQVFMSKYMNYLYIFIVLFFVGISTFWAERTVDDSQSISFMWFLSDIGSLFLSIIIYLYFIKARDYISLAWVALFALIFIITTAFTSIIGISIFPGSVRQMAGGYGVGELATVFKKIGIGDYPFFASLIALSPIFVYFLRSNFLIYKYKIFLLLVFATLLYALTRAEFITALMLYFTFFIVSFLITKKINQTIFIVSILFILSMYVFNESVSNIFYYLSNFFEGTTISYHMRNIGETFQFGDLDPDSQSTYFAGSRLNLARISVNKFIENPLLGTGWGGGHATWLDRLGLYGLLGFFPWIVIFYQQIKLNLLLFDKRFHSYYLTSIYSCILLGFLTTTANSFPVLLVLFCVVPGMYFLPEIINFKHLKNNMD